MSSVDRVSSRHALQKRVRRLLHLEGRPEGPSELLDHVLPFVRNLGSAVLIGGAIRDVARAGKRSFASDFDFVVYDGSRDSFLEKMTKADGVSNRFGGFALRTFSVKVDIWHIEDTWARTAGHVPVNGPADLLRCTFFDWDSALYDVRTGRLMLPDDYFDKLGSNVMDIELEANPNEMGSFVRALRRASLWNVQFGSKLTAFCIRCIEQMRWAELVALDERAFQMPVLRYLDRGKLIERFKSPVADDSNVTLPVPERAQIRLPLPNVLGQEVGCSTQPMQ